MTNNVFDFPAKPFTPADDEGSHGSGEAVCISCKHEWAAVAPVGTTELECPQCARHMGRFKFKWAVPSTTSVWNCNCGNDLFYMTPEGHLCPNCGTYQQY